MAYVAIRGGEDAGTKYFRKATEGRLREQFLPIVRSATDASGATRNFKKLSKRSALLPGLGGDPEQPFDLDKSHAPDIDAIVDHAATRTAHDAARKWMIDAVDGFDADYIGWGKEDSDIIVRLLRTGARRKDGNFAVGVLHLWHPEADRSALPANERKLVGIVGGSEVRARRGLAALAAPPQGTPATRL